MNTFSGSVLIRNSFHGCGAGLTACGYQGGTLLGHTLRFHSAVAPPTFPEF